MTFRKTLHAEFIRRSLGRGFCSGVVNVMLMAFCGCTPSPVTSNVDWRDAIRDEVTLCCGDGSEVWTELDEFTYEQHGRIYEVDGTLILEAGEPGTGIRWAAFDIAKEDYEVRLMAKRIEGSDIFCALTLPHQHSYFTWVIGGWGGQVTGISNIDGEPAAENSSANVVEFEQGRWYALRIRVTSDRIVGWIDDQRVFDESVLDRSLNVWWEQEPARPLGITTWNTSAAIREVRYSR
ncbi:MAG: hypothetical protein KDA60_01215 [Planctomycetales bacterium]|nr:hypothetical protein [Planctomycetales bacterium]